MRRFLFARASRLRLTANFKFQFLSLSDVLRVVAETIEEFALHRRFRPILLGFLAKLLELEPLKVDLFESLHARVLHNTLESALRNLREARQGLNLEVTTLDELVNVLFVDLFIFVLKLAVILRRLHLVGCGFCVYNLGRLDLGLAALSLLLSVVQLGSQVVNEAGLLIVC